MISDFFRKLGKISGNSESFFWKTWKILPKNSNSSQNLRKKILKNWGRKSHFFQLRNYGDGNGMVIVINNGDYFVMVTGLVMIATKV